MYSLDVKKFIRLSQAHLPLTNYLINHNNDFIVVDNVKVVLAHGNYNINDFIAYL